jgi:hypothetical protein
MRRAVIVFAAAGLVGPMIGFLTWPPSDFEERTSSTAADLVYELVFYLWPTQVIAVYESTLGTVRARILSIGANVLFFACLGLLISIVARSRTGSTLAYVGICAVVGMIALWGSGFSLAHVNYTPLLVALAIYGIPVLLIGRTGLRSGDAGERRNPPVATRVDH